MKLIDVTKAFASDEQCLTYLEKSRWPDGVRCTVCGAKEVSKITRKSKSKNKRAQVYQCLEKTCKSQFSATNGTIFHDSHLPLSKWFMAIALLVDAKKSMSALQLSRHLACNYRTAWYLAHRIREAMTDVNAPKLTGVVEVDETYIGGKQRGHKSKLRNKDVVIGVRERGGALRLVHTKDNAAGTLYDVVAKHVSKDAEAIMTDENPSYNFKLTQFHNVRHGRIKHRNHVYVKGDVHTNTVESAFSLLKRGIIGSFHSVSIKHLQRYLNEFGYRFNRREDADIFEQTVSRMAQGKALPYAKLTEENAFTPFVRPS
jgi:ISXO2-like transposase domain/Transposase zinc-ribbon domain